MFYLSGYCITYLVLLWYIFTCEHTYYVEGGGRVNCNVSPEKPCQGTYHDPVIYIMKYAITVIEVVWLWQSAAALLYVIKMYRKKRLEVGKSKKQ